VDAQIFINFDEHVKKTIDLNIEGYVRPAKVYYGFTGDGNPGEETVWYNLEGEPGFETSKNFYIRFRKKTLLFNGFKIKINPELEFNRVIYRISYCYKYRDSHNYDLGNRIDKPEIYFYDAPVREFWETVIY